jgi:hypothetical protein
MDRPSSAGIIIIQANNGALLFATQMPDLSKAKDEMRRRTTAMLDMHQEWSSMPGLS